MQRILIIEDDPDAREMISIALSDSGYECLSSPTAKDGMASCASGKPDLILMDVNLPDGNGIDLCRKIKSVYGLRHIPILILTGAAVDTEARVEGLKAGADDYMIKTIGPYEMLSRIHRVIETSKKPYRPLPV